MPRNRTRRRRLHQQSDENFCFQDWNNWDESIRWEIIDGQSFPPAEEVPPFHAVLIERLAQQIQAQVDATQWQVVPAPALLLFQDEAEDLHLCRNLVQPDLFVVPAGADAHPEHCTRIPALMVEVVAPATSKVDQNEKPDLYAEQRIDQFWLLDPVQQMVWVNRLNERGGYQFPQFVNADAVLEMDTLGGVKIDWIAAFDMS